MAPVNAWAGQPLRYEIEIAIDDIEVEKSYKNKESKVLEGRPLIQAALKTRPDNHNFPTSFAAVTRDPLIIEEIIDRRMQHKIEEIQKKIKYKINVK